MQVTENQERRYINRSAILEKAVPLVRKMHDTLIREIRTKIPETDYEVLPYFESVWIKREVKRLWGIKVLQEEVSYIWQKAVVGF